MFQTKYTAWASVNDVIAKEQWDSCLHRFEHSGNEVRSISFSKTGKWLAAVAFDDSYYTSTINVWDTFTGELATSWDLPSHATEDFDVVGYSEISFSSIEENHLICITVNENTGDSANLKLNAILRLWNVVTGELHHSIAVPGLKFEKEVGLESGLASCHWSVQMISTNLNRPLLAVYPKYIRTKQLECNGRLHEIVDRPFEFEILLLDGLEGGLWRRLNRIPTAMGILESESEAESDRAYARTGNQYLIRDLRFYPNQNPRWVISIIHETRSIGVANRSARSPYDAPSSVCIWSIQTGKCIYSGNIALNLDTANKTKFNPKYFQQRSDEYWPKSRHEHLAISYHDPLVIAVEFPGAIAILVMDDEEFAFDHQFTIFDPFFGNDGMSWETVQTLEFSPYHQSWLLAGYSNLNRLSEIDIWDYRTGSCLFTVKGPSSLPTSLFKFSPHVSGQIASAHGKFVYLWSLHSELMDAKLKEDTFPTVSRNLDSQRCRLTLVSSGSPKESASWRSYSREAVASEMAWICSPDLTMLLFTNKSPGGFSSRRPGDFEYFGRWQISDTTSRGRHLQTPSVYNGAEFIVSCAFSNDGRYLASVGRDYAEVKIWDLEVSQYCSSILGPTANRLCSDVLGTKQEEDAEFQTQLEPVMYGSKFIFSPNSQFVLLLCLGAGVDILVENANHNSPLSKYSASWRYWAAFFDPIPEYYVPRGVWETRTGRFLEFRYAENLLDLINYKNSETFTTQICFSPDSSQIAFNIETRGRETNKCSTLIWELSKRFGESTFNSNREPPSEPELIAVLNFSSFSKIFTLSYTLPDSMGQFQLTTVSSEGTAKIWNPKTWQLISTSLVIPTELRAILSRDYIDPSDTCTDSPFIDGGALEPLDWGYAPRFLSGMFNDKYLHWQLPSMPASPPRRKLIKDRGNELAYMDCSIYFLLGTRLPDLAIAMYFQNGGLTHDYVILLVIWELSSGMRHEFNGFSTAAADVPIAMMLPPRSPHGTPFSENGELLTVTGPIRLQSYTRQQNPPAEHSRESSSHGAIGSATVTPLTQQLNSAPLSVSTFELVRCGIGLSNDYSWVTWNGHNILWIPHAYRYNFEPLIRGDKPIGVNMRQSWPNSLRQSHFLDDSWRHPVFRFKIEHEHICSPRFSNDALLIPARNGYICRYAFDISHLSSLLADFPPIRVSGEPTIYE